MGTAESSMDAAVRQHAAGSRSGCAVAAWRQRLQRSAGVNGRQDEARSWMQCQEQHADGSEPAAACNGCWQQHGCLWHGAWSGGRH